MQTTLDELAANSDKIDGEITSREHKNKIFRKSVFKRLPHRFPDYNALVTQEAISYLYPQSFTIDWDAKEIFIMYSPSGGTSTKRWVVVYNLDTIEYKGCFHAGDAGGEGIVVKYEGGSRYLYAKTTVSSLGKFLITTLPPNKMDLGPSNTYDVGLYYDFSYRNGLWLIEQGGAPLGTSIRRNVFAYYDDSFTLKGTINMNLSDTGPWMGSYVNYVPKKQGVALGDGYIVQATGGYYGSGDTLIPYMYHGIKILNQKGALVSEGLINPSKMMNHLTANGITSTRIEIEGVHIDPSGQLYSLVVHRAETSYPETLTEGIIIFKEMSEETDAFDFSSMAANYTGFNPTVLESGTFPRSNDGSMYDPLTGAKLDTFDKILDFMAGIDLKRFAFYSSATSVKDIAGVTVPNSILVVFQNTNNSTFYVDYYGNPSSKRFTIYGTSGSRSQIGISPNPIGTATIATSGTSISVTHGLGYTPTNIVCTPRANIGSVWVTGITSTAFVINCSTAAAAATVVSWQAV
jgi:hypothetical protein